MSVDSIDSKRHSSSRFMGSFYVQGAGVMGPTRQPDRAHTDRDSRDRCFDLSRFRRAHEHSFLLLYRRDDTGDVAWHCQWFFRLRFFPMFMFVFTSKFSVNRPSGCSISLLGNYHFIEIAPSQNRSSEELRPLLAETDPPRKLRPPRKLILCGNCILRGNWSSAETKSSAETDPPRKLILRGNWSSAETKSSAETYPPRKLILRGNLILGGNFILSWNSSSAEIVSSHGNWSSAEIDPPQKLQDSKFHHRDIGRNAIRQNQTEFSRYW